MCETHRNHAHENEAACTKLKQQFSPILYRLQNAHSNCFCPLAFILVQSDFFSDLFFFTNTKVTNAPGKERKLLSNKTSY